MNTPTAPNPTGAATTAGTLALWITADGAITSVTLPPSEGERGDALREMVGGWLDLVRLSDRLDMWVNDEGLFQFPEPNVTASRVAGVFGFDWQPYHGPAVLTGTDGEGNTVGLDRTGAALLSELAFAAAGEGPLRPEEVDGHRARTYRDVLGL